MKGDISPDLEQAVLLFCFGYKDEFDRTWRDIKNPSHTNGVFWQRITRWLGERSMAFDEHDLKFAIKRVYARLERGEPFGTLEEMVAFAVANKDDYRLTFTSDMANLRQYVGGELVATIRDSRAGALALDLLREMVGV